MKYTLLELTQAVLRSIKGEQVNDIADTDESNDVVSIIKECFYTLISSQDFPEVKNLFELNASGNVAKPVLMTIPDDVYTMEWLKYNAVRDGDTDPVWNDISFLQLKDFLDHTGMFNTEETEVLEMSHVVGSDTLQFKYRNDRAPSFFTTLDDESLIFDSYDSEVETTLSKAKTQAYGIRIADFNEDNDYVLPLDNHQFQILLKEAKAMAWQEMKSIDNRQAKLDARKLRISAEGRKSKANQKNMGYWYDQYPNYGRK